MADARCRYHQLPLRDEAAVGRRRNDHVLSRSGPDLGLGDDEEPLCRTMRTEAAVYRFTWRSFDGRAVVRVGR